MSYGISVIVKNSKIFWLLIPCSFFFFNFWNLLETSLYPQYSEILAYSTLMWIYFNHSARNLMNSFNLQVHVCLIWGIFSNYFIAIFFSPNFSLSLLNFFFFFFFFCRLSYAFIRDAKSFLSPGIMIDFFFWRLKKFSLGSSHGGSVEMNPISIQEDTGLIPGPNQWIKDLALPWAVL